ncbi:hypothetical protein [Arsenophonus nasoniae]|uniref:Uncharacterized protein n=1 Tax=Arsenophonus nasoniae TaxID=638 RepID=A0AA95KC03_9GAMM|nr:hypothetical protein [Arsenophonus nasoniae]WGM03741.1 hypothetical protein QE210_19845 [Arsenophonus nasoniae]
MNGKAISSLKNHSIIRVKKQAKKNIAVILSDFFIRLITRAIFYFPVIFFWLTVGFVTAGYFNDTFPFVPDVNEFSMENLFEELKPIFRYSLSLTAIVCLVRECITFFK